MSDGGEFGAHDETLRFNDMANKLRAYCEDELVALDQRVGVLLGDADLVLCRNVLIYFTEAQSRTAVTTLCCALAPGGVLLLGPADGLREVTGFEKVCHPGTVFWRKQDDR